MLNKIKIGPKLIGGFIFISLIATLIGVIGITQMMVIEDADTMLYERITMPLAELLGITESFQRIRVNMHKILLADTHAERLEYRDTINKLSKEIEKHSEAVQKSLITDEAKKEFSRFVETRKVYRANLEKILAMVEANRLKDAENLVNGAASKAALAEQEEIDKLVKNKIDMAKKTSGENTALAQRASLVMIIIILAGLAVSVFMGIALTLSITRPLNAIVGTAGKIKLGDLDVSVDAAKRQDELGILADAFGGMVNTLKDKAAVLEKIADGDLNVFVKLESESDRLGKSMLKMKESLNDALWQVNAAVEQVSAGAGQVSSASQSLSQGASEQASSLEEITSSITEINSQSKQNADNATQVNQMAKNAMEGAEAGNKQMKDLVLAMTDINKSADGIKKIAKAIDDIAFQINLLALNANVEAARAGKYGKGFAVVADEVRNLAARSGNSVKEATALVDDAIKNITNGNKLAEVTAKQIEEIVEIATKVAAIAEEVTIASKEQAVGLDQISVGLGQIDQVTQANTSNAEESASASEELASQAQQLKALVARFKLASASVKEQGQIEASSELIQRLVAAEMTKREKNAHMNKLHEINAKGNGKDKGDGKGFDKQVPVAPKDVIKLDDQDFGHF